MKSKELKKLVKVAIRSLASIAMDTTASDNDRISAATAILDRVAVKK